MDFAIWLQHVMVHAIPVLWRLHRMHHADLDYDVTTGARFHPLEILLSMGLKLAVIALLGPSAAAVIVFEVTLNATAMFNHGNLRLPRGLDGAVRWFLVTPDMHRVHHSIRPDESNCNFGFNLPWWDRLFGTYRPAPAEGHETMTLGIDAFRTREDLRLDRLLTQLFRGTVGDYPINRRPFEQEASAETSAQAGACDGLSHHTPPA
ncbi:MAG: sterol desaturase-like protein [Rhodospirillaceae bacterium]|nr:MAG: sterol desaturase-like protein [Rhodospirillaceae bacterium]